MPDETPSPSPTSPSPTSLDEAGAPPDTGQPAVTAPGPSGVEPPPVSARAHAVFWLAIGCAVVGIVQVPMALLGRRAPAPYAAPSASASTSGPSPGPASGSPAVASSSTTPPASAADPSSPELAPEPAPFRVAQLESATTEVVHAKVGKRTCMQALTAIGVTTTDAARVAVAVAPIRTLDGCSADDRLFVATSRPDHKLAGLELETAPGEILRVVARALLPGAPAGGAPDDLIAEVVSMPVTHRRHATAFVVGDGLAASIAAAGLDPSLIEHLDEAIGSRTDVPAPARGSVFRVIADATWVGGRFDRYDELVAFEYRPRPGGAPLRLYHVREQAKGKNHGWFDGKGHQPVRAKWRMPLAFPKITSRFNPKRMHPVLKRVMPHNGCDFGAPTGTPVYAIGPGVVSFRGDAGPSGNLITIRHEGGIDSGYAHLSRFAPGIVSGTRVEARTLVGYVGTTGRSTGPHLHLSVKRNGVFIDPLSLKMDAFRVVPRAERSGFTARKAEADAALDAIDLPKLDAAAAPAPDPAKTADDTLEDDHPH